MKTVNINAKDLTHRQLNERIRAELSAGAGHISLLNVNGHRYIASGINSSAIIDIHGTAGNDLGSFLSGCHLNIFGNAQDCAANTMNSGKIVIRGSVGDILGYGLRGGKIFVGGNTGYRTGIHMKSYKDMIPVIVIGGAARDFCAEYMAGGIIILLGLKHKSGILSEDESREDIIGNFIGTGMHGGTVYIRGNIKKYQLGREVSPVKLNDADMRILNSNIMEFCRDFRLDSKKILKKEFIKLTAVNHRPYGAIYAY